MDPHEQARAKDAAWIGRYRSLRLKLALVIGALALIGGGIVWLKDKLFTIDPGQGAPIGWSVRANDHIATLIQTLEPYVPSLHRDHSKDTYSIGIFIVPLDGAAPKLVPISGGHSGNSLGLAQVLGSDGRTMWFDVNGVGGVDVKTFALLTGSALRDAPPSNLQGARPHHLEPRLEAVLSSGFFVNDHEWRGVLAQEEAQGEYAPKQWLRRIAHATNAKRMRRFHRGSVGDTSPTGSRRIRAMEPIGDAEYLNAALLRMDDKSEPIRMSAPDGALMIHTSMPGLKGTLIVSRVDTEGRIIWQVDTEIDRFKLSQILPGMGSTAFLGTRLPVPDKVPEPLLVIVENSTGEMATHSLWR